ncbi:MAG: hypothetical protein JW966_14390 [Anaerolineae bacterium]|nr:hypothetical protein [Anaerolineae bacterium]
MPPQHYKVSQRTSSAPSGEPGWQDYGDGIDVGSTYLAGPDTGETAGIDTDYGFTGDRYYPGNGPQAKTASGVHQAVAKAPPLAPDETEETAPAYEPEMDYESNERYATSAPAITSERPPVQAEGYQEPFEHDMSANHLSYKERQELLIHTIQLYDDEWKLAGIRANLKKDWLVAYLVPRARRLDLRTAISRQQVLVITVDNRGNTDIKEPKKRGVWRMLTNWLYGQ